MLGTEPPGRCPDDALGKIFLRACGRVSRDGKARGAAGRFKHLPRPPAPWRRLALASHGRARCGRYLTGSFTTTLTPAMTLVTALRTCWTACWLTSPAPLMAPVAAAEAASSTLRPTCLAPKMAPSTVFLATVPRSPPTSSALLPTVRALTRP